ncbi:lectin-like [Amphibalanus amphitrite]|uniref:lectin-like n=1 Tax=Amphibalanus amphitrite TaxID=1232801 RepID=UPI001C9286C2|nr:lectin-like [Amphibalanus amphitrite]
MSRPSVRLLPQPPLVLLLLVTAVAVPPALSSPVPASRFWMLAWSDHKMTVLASGCAAVNFDPSVTPLPCRLLACEEGWEPFDSNCYYYGASATDWLTAEVIHCNIERASRLTSIHSAEENDFIKTLADANGASRLHIGLQRSDRGFVWVDQSPFSYTNWNEGEGNDLPVLPITVSMAASVGGMWADNPMTDVFPFVCKRARVLPATP